MTDRQLIDELEKWRAEYDFNFQIWSEDRVNCSIQKGDIRIAEFNQCDTIREGFEKCVGWIKAQNPKGIVHPEPIGSRCLVCGCKIAINNDICGECAFEDDCGA
jgi:hypothetical protein